MNFLNTKRKFKSLKRIPKHAIRDNCRSDESLRVNNFLK